MSSISVYGYDPSMLAAIGEYEESIDEAILAPGDVGFSLRNMPTYSETSETKEIPENKERLTTCPFLDLPFEIRHEILSYIMPRTFYLHPGTDAWYRAAAPIWATCRSVYDECMRMLYGNCTFNIVITYGSTTFSQRYVSDRQGYRGRTLIPGRRFDFPESISEANRVLVRKVRLSIIRPDGYGGIVQHDCSSPYAIALGLCTRVHRVCEILRMSSEIQTLYIDYYDSPGDNERQDLDMMRFILQNLYELKNLRTVKIWVNNPDPAKTVYISQTELGLARGCKEKSLLDLPSHVRMEIYRHLFPCSDDAKRYGLETLIRHYVNTAIMRTCRVIYNETTDFIKGSPAIDLPALTWDLDGQLTK